MAYDLYVITDETIARGLDHAEIARRAIDGGADAIQLRDKCMSARELYATAREIRDVTRASGVLFIVNDRLDVAIAAGADGVHLGQDDLPLAWAKRIAPPGFIVGISVGCVDEAVRAAEGGADYVALSPTYSTGSKGDAGPGRGLAELAAIRAAITLPLIAIGGIGHDNVSDVIARGADGIAVISAVVGRADIRGAAREMKSLIAAAKAAARHPQMQRLEGQ